MRVFFSGPRIMGIRPGVSFGAEDLRARQSATPQRAATGAMEGGFVYVIRGDHNLVKVGVSTNPSARLAQLRTASAFPLSFAYVCAVEGDAMQAVALERAAQAILAKHQTNGEWFDVPAEMAVAAIAAASHTTGRRVIEVAPDQVDAIIRIASQEGAVAALPPPSPAKDRTRMIVFGVILVIFIWGGIAAMIPR